MGYDENHVDALYWAMLVHDIGKIDLPIHIWDIEEKPCDDIKEQREIASLMLERLGYSGDAVTGGEEAIRFLQEKSVDIILLDMIMTPGIDGLETYRQLIEIAPHLKVIIVSGFSESAKVREAQQLGAGPYVKKPYGMDEIAKVLRQELKR